MNVHAYVNGEYLFTINSDVFHENVKNESDKRQYIGIRGSEEMVSIYNEVEKQLLAGNYGIQTNSDDQLDSSSLDDMNISEYLAKKFPNIERLELRADDNRLTSKVSNTMGKQYGYPLVWLNCNKYNFTDSINQQKLKEHQWERCIFQPKQSLDKIGSLIKYFEVQKQHDEQALYKGGVATAVDCVKNSATDNLLLKDRRVSTSVSSEIAQMQDYEADQGFAFYETPTRATYITTNVASSLNDVLQKGLFDEHAIEYDEFEVIGGGSKTIKILSPALFATSAYSHVTMQAITLTVSGGKVNCDVTLSEGLLSDPFKVDEQNYVAQTKQQVIDFLTQHNLEVGTVTTKVQNLKLQLPLQTHCGRFVMTWMAAEVAGVDITKLSNYSEPFNQIFAKIEKRGDKIFPSGDEKVHPTNALSHFRTRLEDFLRVREEEYSKQYLSSGKNELVLTRELITLIDNLQNGKNIDNLPKIEQNIKYLSDARLIKVINEGMANLGYGSIQTFLTQAKTEDFKLSTRDSIRQQYKTLNKSEPEKKLSVDDFLDDELDLDESIEEDDVFEVIGITGKQLAVNEQIAKVNPEATRGVKEKVAEVKKEKEEELIPPTIKVNT